MAKVRLSTTVDEVLLKRARRQLPRGATDARLLEEALKAFLAAHREAEIDASYAAYDAMPLSTPDAWGDLESWRKAAGRS